MADEITVDRQTLKALGADSRIAILKKLAQRRMTQAELAHELGISAPSVAEHLVSLAQAGLIAQAAEEKERKWKYYELTQKGAAIVRPSQAKKILFVLGLLLLAFAFYATQVLPKSGLQQLSLPFSTPAPTTGFFDEGQAFPAAQKTAVTGLPSPEAAQPEEMPPAPPQEVAATLEPTPTARAQVVSSVEAKVKPGETIYIGSKNLKLVSISPIAIGSSTLPFVYFELQDAEGNRIDYFSMSKDTPPYEKNGVFLDVRDVFVGGGDSSYAEVNASSKN